MVNTDINLVNTGINSTIAGVAKTGQREQNAREGVGLRLLSLRGSWVQIPPPALDSCSFGLNKSRLSLIGDSK